jgi:hypothetical protein
VAQHPAHTRVHIRAQRPTPLPFATQLEAQIESTFVDGSKNVSVHTRLGVRGQQMPELFARQLVEHMSGGRSKARPLVLALGMKTYDFRTLRAIAHICKEQNLL